MRSSHGEQICVSQTTLNQVTGHRYARMNAPESLFTILQTQDQDTLVDPALMEWTTVTISAALAAERGLNFTTARGLISEMNVRYKHDKEAVTRTVTYLWERETVGLPGVTVPPPEIPPADDYEPIPPADFQDEWPDGDAWGGSPNGVFVWNYSELFRTWDIKDVSPTWEQIGDCAVDMSPSTIIYDVQQVMYGATSVGAYALTDVGLYWCADIMAAADLTWDLRLSNATIQASEVQPTPSVNDIMCFTTWGKNPGFVIIGSGEKGSATAQQLSNYKHAYFWHSHDYGQTWTGPIDAGGDHLYSSFADGDGYRSYCRMPTPGLAMYRDDDGIIYACRMSSTMVLQQWSTIFWSEDQGHTWNLDSSGISSQYQNQHNGAISHPYPDRTSLMFFMGGSIGVSNRSDLWKSDDEFSTKTLIVDSNVFPVGYGGLPACRVPNTDPFRNLHGIVPIHYTTGGSPYPSHMMETTDGGVSWQRLGTRVFENGNRAYSQATFGNCAWSTPNGWPGDPDWWFTIRSWGTTTGTTIFLTTDDNFATDDDRNGNIATIVGTNNWEAGGNGGGFAMPKVGPNA
jgi:hypothetical protein